MGRNTSKRKPTPAVARLPRRTGKPVTDVPGKPPRLLIEAVSPKVDGGRFPCKRIVGDVVQVGADIVGEGHDLHAARIAYRGPGDARVQHAGMHFNYDLDRWFGEFVVDRIGRWTYYVEAWVDAFGTWCDELRKKVAAGQEVESELLEGAQIIRRAARLVKGEAAARLREAAKVIGDRRVPAAEREATALSPEVAALMGECIDRRVVTRSERDLVIAVDRERAGFAAWYEMFPRSQGTEPGKHGTFRDAQRRLEELAELGFDVIYLPPIHPIGKTNRKGRNNTLQAGPDDPGSPWAIGSEDGGHTAIEPQLGTMADFERFVRKAESLGMEVALDYALQCSPDHPWLEDHPEWYFVRPDGTLKYAENPPKKYQDIYPLNFWCKGYESLWAACRDLFEFWIEHGVRTFRVDNPHTKPLAFWEWVIQDIQSRHPDVVFLSEAFTRPKRMKALAKLGFTQSYTYLTWRNTSWALREYLTELTQTSMAEYFRGNLFANTPDILHEYLQHGGRPAFRVRLLLAATLSPIYGICSGFELCENVPVRPDSEEYLHSEKYEIRVRDWNAPGNIKDDIRRINRIRRENPALQRYANLRFHSSENDQILFYHKHAEGNDLLIAVNVDPHHVQETMVHVPLADLGLGHDQPFGVEDLLTGERYGWRGVRNYVRLDPAEKVGHVLRLIR